MAARSRERAASLAEKPIWLFVWWGYLVGGLVPVLCVFTLDKLGIEIVPSNYQLVFDLTALSFCCLGSGLLFPAAFFARHKRTGLASSLLLVAAIVSVCSLHLLVLATGGPRDSVFGFHYLYLPAVVALSLRTRRTIIMTSLACLASFSLNTFLPEPLAFRASSQWSRISGEVSYDLVFCGAFVLQLLVATILACNHAPSGASMNIMRRQRFGWYIFDFANSILVATGGLYFSQWLVLDRGVPEYWFNGAIALSAALTLLVAPRVGAVLDRGGSKRVALAVTSLIMLFSTLLLHQLAGVPLSVGAAATSAILLFVVLFSTYQLSLAVYNSFLPDLADAKSVDRVSGIGMGMGWLGSLVGIAAVTPFVTGPLQFRPGLGRGQAFLPAALLYLFATALGLVLLRSSDRRTSSRPVRNPSGSFLSVGEICRAWSRPAIRRLLFFYVLFSGAVIGLQNNFALSMEKLTGVDDTVKALTAAAGLIAGAVGAFLVGPLVMRIGRRRSLLFAIGLSGVSVFAMAVADHAIIFGITLSVASFGATIAFSLARTSYIDASAPGRVGASLGVLGGFERASSVFGPVGWGAVMLIGGGTSGAYRMAIGLMAAVATLSYLFASKAVDAGDEESRSGEDEL